MRDGKVKQLRVPRDPWAPAFWTTGFVVKGGEAIAAKGGHCARIWMAALGHNGQVPPAGVFRAR